MFSSQGQVSSIIITFLDLTENKKISGRNVEIAIKEGITRCSRSLNKIQSDASCKAPLGNLLVFLGTVPCLTKFIYFEDGLVTDNDDKKDFNSKTTISNTASCLYVYLPCARATLHVPKICGVVQTCFLHKKQLFSVETCHLCKLEGDGRVSYVAPRQKDIKFWGKPNKVFQERSCFT